MAAPSGQAPSCTGAQGDAFAPRRLAEVARGYGDAGFLSSICEPDYAPLLDHFVDTLERAGAKGDEC